MKNKIAFTLVELIVVILVIAILGTIGYLSFYGYLGTARDSKRFSELSEIRNGLQLYLTLNLIYPEPSDNKISINYESRTLITQGYAGEDILRDTRMLGKLKDPLDDVYYTYSVNEFRTKFQLLTMLENSPSVNLYDSIGFSQKVYAGDYIDRYPYMMGYSIGTLLDTHGNIPIQETTFENIDLLENDTDYKIIFGNTESDKFTLSGDELYTKILEKTYNVLLDTSTTSVMWKDLDPNCEIEDIEIGNGQIWAGCNSTLGDGFEWGQTVSDFGTSNYNGTIFNCFPNYNGVTNPSEPTCQPGHELMASNSKANTWYSGTNGNGDNEYNTIWGKLYTWDMAMGNSGYIGACPNGRKVPSNQDWASLENYLNGSTCRNFANIWQCDGLGWMSNNTKTENNNLANALIIPLSGNRRTDGTSFNSRGNLTYLWSSESINTNAFRINLNWNNTSVNFSNIGQASGFSVRCIKE